MVIRLHSVSVCLPDAQLPEIPSCILNDHRKWFHHSFSRQMEPASIQTHVRRCSLSHTSEPAGSAVNSFGKSIHCNSGVKKAQLTTLWALLLLPCLSTFLFTRCTWGGKQWGKGDLTAPNSLGRRKTAFSSLTSKLTERLMARGAFRSKAQTISGNTGLIFWTFP